MVSHSRHTVTTNLNITVCVVKYKVEVNKMHFSLPCVYLVIFDLFFLYSTICQKTLDYSTAHKKSEETFQLKCVENNGQSFIEIGDSSTCSVWCINYFTIDHVL